MGVVCISAYSVQNQNLAEVISYLQPVGYKGYRNTKVLHICTVMPTKSDSDVIFCLHFLSKSLS